MFRYVLRITLFFFAVAGCGIRNEQREATTFSPEAFRPMLDDYRPDAMTASSDSSSSLCSATNCATAVTALSPLFGSDATSLRSLIETLDTTLSSISERAKIHFVPCLEGSATSVTSTVSTQTTLTSRLGCYHDSDSPLDSTLPAQLALGVAADVKNDFHVSFRMGEVPTAVETLWVRYTENSSLDIWRGYNGSATSSGASLLHLRLDPASKRLEFATAGLNQFAVANHFECGVQGRFTGDYLYLKGTFSPATASTSTDCSTLSESTFCLQTSDLTTLTSESTCTSLELDQFELDAISPTDLQFDTHGQELMLNVSTKVERLVMLGLQIQERTLRR